MRCFKRIANCTKNQNCQDTEVECEHSCYAFTGNLVNKIDHAGCWDLNSRCILSSENNCLEVQPESYCCCNTDLCNKNIITQMITQNLNDTTQMITQNLNDMSYYPFVIGLILIMIFILVVIYSIYKKVFATKNKPIYKITKIDDINTFIPLVALSISLSSLASLTLGSLRLLH